MLYERYSCEPKQAAVWRIQYDILYLTQNLLGQLTSVWYSSSVLEPHDVTCLSQDDKAKVPLGLPAANKQSTIVKNMEYEVKLPDHDFVVASGHKLTPSVIAGLEVFAGNFDHGVSYSGPTYISIRSGKHAADLRHLYANVQAFKPLLYREDGLTKPILVIFVDGGPDENPRYKETIKFACSNFIQAA